MLEKYWNYKEDQLDKLNALLKLNNGRRVDNYHLYLADLCEIRNPSLYKKVTPEYLSKFTKEFEDASPKNQGQWVYFPWRREAHLYPPEEVYYELFTARNKPIILKKAQQDFYNFNVGIVGLSIGQSTAFTLVRSGGAKNIKLADPDIISPTNLNRIYVRSTAVGKLKTEAVAEDLYEINPYLNIELYHKGVTKTNINDFFTKGFKLDVVVDACDNIPIKIAIREKAKELKIPVVMATDMVDSVLLDVERYDINPNTKLFGGRLDNIGDQKDFLKTTITLIDPDFMPLDILEIIPEIGKTVATHPQIATGAYLAGIVSTMVIRYIALKKDLNTSRVSIDLNQFLDSYQQDSQYSQLRLQKIAEFKKILQLENL